MVIVVGHYMCDIPRKDLKLKFLLYILSQKHSKMYLKKLRTV